MPRSSDARESGGRPRRGRTVAGVALVAAAALATVLAGCSKTTDDALQVDPAGFTVEPAAAVGPDAFTPPVTNDTSICDKKQLVSELQARPDAYREWAKVLNLPADAVPAYIESLQPVVLSSDTKVTNHGLRNGQAYARPSVLTKGTAVLMSNKMYPTGTTAGTTPGTTPGVDVPVTRCKCGNPLLPPPTTTGTTPPGSTGTTPPGTGTTPPQTRPTRTVPPSSTTTSTTSTIILNRQSTTTTTPASSSTTTSQRASSTTNAGIPIRDAIGVLSGVKG